MINQIESEVTVEYIVDLLKEHMKEFDYVWSEFEKVNYKKKIISYLFFQIYLNQLMIIEADARKPLLIAINIENTLFTAEIKVKI